MWHYAALVCGRRACSTLCAVFTAYLLTAAPADLMASPALTLSSSVAAPERVSLVFLRAPATELVGYSASLAPRLEVRKVHSASLATRPVARTQSLDWAVSPRQPAARTTPAAISLGRNDASLQPVGGVASLHQSAAPHLGDAAMTALHHAERRQAVFSTASVIEPNASSSQSPSQLHLPSEPRGSAYPLSSPVGAIAMPGVGLR